MHCERVAASPSRRLKFGNPIAERLEIANLADVSYSSKVFVLFLQKGFQDRNELFPDHVQVSLSNYCPGLELPRDRARFGFRDKRRPRNYADHSLKPADEDSETLKLPAIGRQGKHYVVDRSRIDCLAR